MLATACVSSCQFKWTKTLRVINMMTDLHIPVIRPKAPWVQCWSKMNQHVKRLVVWDNRSMQVGMDPTVVQQREGTLRAEAAQAVSQVQSQKQEGSDMLRPFIKWNSPSHSKCRGLQIWIISWWIPRTNRPINWRSTRNMVAQLQNHMITAQHAPPTVPPIAPESRNGAVNEQELMRLWWNWQMGFAWCKIIQNAIAASSNPHACGLHSQIRLKKGVSATTLPTDGSSSSVSNLGKRHTCCWCRRINARLAGL